jgi:hypothetical protein
MIRISLDEENGWFRLEGEDLGAFHFEDLIEWYDMFRDNATCGREWCDKCKHHAYCEGRLAI